jgi:pimeloyl-ACP methyl ester carboxylesterase
MWGTIIFLLALYAFGLYVWFFLERKKNFTKKASILKYETFGSRDKPVMVFVHGWPDSGQMWEHQVNLFKKNFYCVCITFPGNDGVHQRAWGYNAYVSSRTRTHACATHSIRLHRTCVGTRRAARTNSSQTSIALVHSRHA